MKTYLVLFLTFAIHSLQAQTDVPEILSIDSKTGKYTITGVIQIGSKPRQLLLEGAYKWLSEVKFVNTLGSKGIQMDEAVFGRLTVNQYFISAPTTYNSKIRYILILEFRDGRFRYQFSDFSYIAVTKRKDFESVTATEDKSLVATFLNESNNYIRNFISEISAYLEQYKEDESW